MKNILFLLLATTMLMVSCSKEESLETGGTGGTGGGGTGGGGSTSGALLIKVVTTGVQASTQDFSYDGSNRLQKFVLSANSAGLTSGATITITRDSEGRVSKMVQNNTAMPPSPATSMSVNFFYQGPTDKKLKYAIGLLDDGTGSGTTRDSIVYEYTASNLTKITHHYSFDDGANYSLFNYLTFKYDARGNVIEQRVFSDDGSGIEEIQVVLTEYDSKSNPCNFDDDAYLEYGLGQYLSTNNPVKQTVDISIAGISYSGTVSYTYRSDGKPSKTSGSALGISFQSTYTYK